MCNIFQYRANLYLAIIKRLAVTLQNQPLSPFPLYQPTISPIPYPHILNFLPHTNPPPIQSPIIPFSSQPQIPMATISPATILAAAAVVGPGSRSSQRGTAVKLINGLNSFGGLKAHNNVVSLGLPVSTEQSFANVVSSLKKAGKSSRGGAMTSTCSSAIDEIFKISAIMPALVLVGVAVGFVLLRIEAFVEEE